MPSSKRITWTGDISLDGATQGHIGGVHVARISEAPRHWGRAGKSGHLDRRRVRQVLHQAQGAGAQHEGRREVSAPHIIRRLGTTPAQRGSTAAATCPDVFLLSDGRVAYIGTDLTEELRDQLPPGASLGERGRAVALPRNVLLDANPDLSELAERYVPEPE